MSLASLIRERYEQTLERIRSAEKRTGRVPNSTKLVVVTKTQPLEVVQAALEAGVQILGENYPEEAVTKIQQLGSTLGVDWHMIGHVQSRKADLIPGHFSLLHSLDSLRLATRLSRMAVSPLPVLLEFNVGDEPSKQGWPASHESLWPALLSEVDMVLKLPNISVRGLMTMPPLFTQPELARPYFIKLRKLRDWLVVQFPQVDWSELSMGTSADFETAVEEGASLVRVGTAIVGVRPPKARE